MVSTSLCVLSRHALAVARSTSLHALRLCVLFFFRRLATWCDGRSFKLVFISLVCINGVLIGVESDYAEDSDKSIWVGIEAFFLTAFVTEIILKLIGFGLLFFTDGWNIFDFSIVGISVVELVMTTVLQQGSSGLSSFRMFRIFRIVRVINFVARLNLLVQEAHKI